MSASPPRGLLDADLSALIGRKMQPRCGDACYRPLKQQMDTEVANAKINLMHVRAKGPQIFADNHLICRDRPDGPAIYPSAKQRTMRVVTTQKVMRAPASETVDRPKAAAQNRGPVQIGCLPQVNARGKQRLCCLCKVSICPSAGPAQP